MHNFSGLRIILFLFLVFFINTVYSQRMLKDRLTEDPLKSIQDKLKVLEGKKGIINDSLRLELVNKMAVLYMKRSKDTALYYAQNALAEAKALHLKNVTAVSLYNIGCIHEHYKDFVTAEQTYLEWMEIRKNQNDDEYRWALHEMRQFYCKTRQKEKLEKIEEEWLVVLDRQLIQGHISPWFDWEDPTPGKSYQYSMKPVFPYLIKNKHYFLAERSFIHMIEKCPECSNDWSTADYIYFSVEGRMLREKDTTALALWYEHWYSTLEKYGPGKETSLETFNRIAQGYTSGYFKYDQYFDRFYPLMLSYTEKIGGDTAVHNLLMTSSRRYISSFDIKLKVNLFLLLSSIKVKDNSTMEKTYTKTDGLITEYISRGNSKYDLLMLLVDAKSKSEDKRYMKWCNKKIKGLE